MWTIARIDEADFGCEERMPGWRITIVRWKNWKNPDEERRGWVDIMGLFKKKPARLSYDKENQKPIIKASICNGEQVAGFKNKQTGKFEEVMLIKDAADLDSFKVMYGIDGDIEKEY